MHTDSAKILVATVGLALLGFHALAAPARLAPLSAYVGRIAEGETVFANRQFVFSAEASRALGDQPFIRFSNQDSIDLTVEASGELVVVTPVPESTTLSKAAELERCGFVRDNAIKPFQPFGGNPADKAAVWHREMKTGEVLRLSKCWSIVCGFDESNQTNRIPALSEKDRHLIGRLRGRPSASSPRDILVNKPDYAVFVPRMPQSWQSPKNPGPRTLERFRMTGDSYNDHFQVVDDPLRKMLYAFWTQATYEGAVDQHIAFSKSSDGGVTWSEPVVLAGSECFAFPRLRASWQQPMLTKSGRLYCLWNQQTTSRGPHCGQMFGSYSDDAGDTWSSPKQVLFPQRMDQDDPNPLVPPMWCNWQRPLRLGEAGKFFVGCSRHGKAPYDRKSCCKIEFWQFENIDENPLVEDIRIRFFATNRDMLDATKIAPISGVKYFEPITDPHGNPEDPAVEEASIVKLPDGRLFAVMRSSIGCPVWSQSRDGGRTWTAARPLLDKDGGMPYRHPRSPCPFYDWKGPEAGSGYYFGLIHCTFDMAQKTAYQNRGPLYLIAGRFNPNSEQPVEFSAPRLFAPRPYGNSFYSSYTVLDGKGVLWFNDKKYYLLGRRIGAEWFERTVSSNATGSGAPPENDGRAAYLPQPIEETRQRDDSIEDYRVTVGGKQIKLYTADCDWDDLAKRQEGEYYFGGFDFVEPVEVRVTSSRSLDCVRILPEKYGIKPVRDGANKISFMAEKPFRISIEREGRTKPLLLFADPPELGTPKPDSPSVVYYGPGYHDAGKISLGNNQTLYLARGAVVSGAVEGRGTNITIRGRGIICQRAYGRFGSPAVCGLDFRSCANVLIEGITFRNPCNWVLMTLDCENVVVDNFKLCGGRMINDDATDPCNTRKMVIRNSFFRSVDDVFAIKGNIPEGRQPACEDILIEDCEAWTDGANIFRIGFECSAERMCRYTARNIDVLHYSLNYRAVEHPWSNCIFFLQASNDINLSNVLFEDIRIYSDGTPCALISARSMVCGVCGRSYTTAGSLTNVTFRNISVEGVGEDTFIGGVFFEGDSPERTVTDVTLEGIRLFDKRLSAADGRIKIGKYAHRIVVR